MKQFQTKIYVGIGNKFVVCEPFPNDELHAGLHEILDFMNTDDNEVSSKIKPGKYIATMSLENNILNDPQDDDAYLVIDKLEPCD